MQRAQVCSVGRYPVFAGMQCAARPVYTAPTSLSTSVITLLSSMPAHLLNVLEVERVWAGRLGSGFGVRVVGNPT
jgi:hypothetical protein